MEWVASSPEGITRTSIESFADSCNYTYVSDRQVTAAEISTWTTTTGEPIFPLSYNGVSLDVGNEDTWSYFPRQIKGGGVIMKFDTNWIIVVGGEEAPAYAYALLSDDQTKLSLYHIWGE